MWITWSDDDGVTFGDIMVGQLDARVTVNVQNAPNGAKLDAWIDFNGDGIFSSPLEQFFDSFDVDSTTGLLTFNVAGPVFAGVRPCVRCSGQAKPRFARLAAAILMIPGDVVPHA